MATGSIRTLVYDCLCDIKSEEKDDHKCDNTPGKSFSCTDRYEQKQMPQLHRIPKKHQMYQPPSVSKQSNMPQLPKLTRIPQDHEYSPHLNMQQQGTKAGIECESFSHATDLTRHSHTVSKQSKMPQLPQLFRIPQNLEYSTQKHQGLEVNKCKPSGDSFYHPYVLKRHIHTHTVHEGHQDPQCESFVEVRERKHIQNNHDCCKDYKCGICDKSFPQVNYLNSHIYIIHEGHKDYKCESCGKFFSQKGNLKQHIQSTHEGCKEDKCSKLLTKLRQVRQVRHLKRHINTIHEGHKDHKCESCGKSFSLAGNLKKHIHTVQEGHKDFKCKSCCKVISTADNSEQHTNTVYERKKEIKYGSCGISISPGANLEKHIHRKEGYSEGRYVKRKNEESSKEQR